MMEEDSTVMNVNISDAEDTEAKMKTFMMYKIGKSVCAFAALNIHAKTPLSVFKYENSG